MTGRFRELEEWMLEASNIAQERYGRKVSIFDEIPWEGYFGDDKRPWEAVEIAAEKYQWRRKE